MSNIRPVYDTATAITCTMASKTSGQGRRSASVDISSTTYNDVEITVALKTGTVSAGSYFLVYVYASLDGTNYETGGSTDADYNTLAGDEHFLAYKECPSSTTTYTVVANLSDVFKTPPPNFGIIIYQVNCGTLSATESDHIKKYRGIYHQAA